MPSVILVNKSGDLKETEIKEMSIENICKKSGSKDIKNFKLLQTWNVTLDQKYEIMVYGKDKGRAGQENKYEMPPPIDSMLIFGTCVLVNKDGQLTLTEWENIYDKLYGGFEDIGSEDSEDEDDDESVDYETTKSGYKKDGFIVDDADDDEIFEYEDELSEEEYL